MGRLARRLYHARPVGAASDAAATVLGRALVRRAVDVGDAFLDHSALVLAPHPDDETLGCGATIHRKRQAGARVTVVVVTDGRFSHRSTRLSADELASIREQECRRACARLGVPDADVRFLRFPESSLVVRRAELAAALEAVIAEVRPEQLLIPSGIDRLADHRELNRAALAAAGRAAEPPDVYEYPVWMWDPRAWVDRTCSVPRQLAQLASRPVLELRRLRPVVVRTGRAVQVKARALDEYRSQMTNLTGEDGWPTMPPRFLQRFLGPVELFFTRPAATRRVGVVHVLPDLAMGGGQVIVHNLTAAPVPGVRHLVVALGPGPMARTFAQSGTPVEILTIEGPAQFCSAVRVIASRVRRDGWDVVHTTNTPRDRLFGIAVGKLSGRPVVNTLMAVATSHAPRQHHEALAPFLTRRAGNLANRVLARVGIDQLVALSDTVRRAHATALRLPAACIEVVHPGIPAGTVVVPRPTSTGGLAAELGIDGAFPVLISIGRLEENKGQTDLVEVMRSVVEVMPAATLLLVGDGPDRDRLVADFGAAGLAGHTRLLGRRHDVAELLELSHIMVSTAHLEGFGMAGLEALAAGCPVVGYVNDRVALGEFVEEGVTGRLVSEDPAALADAIVALARDRAALATTAAACRAAAARFTAERSAAHMAQVCRQVARVGDQPPPTQPSARRSVRGAGRLHHPAPSALALHRRADTAPRSDGQDRTIRL